MATYKIDPTHSEITFKVKHLMITNVTGKLTKFDATMQSEREDFTDAVVTFEADVNSITTHNEQRDVHLKSDDFFNVEKYPKITFRSTALKKESEDYKLFGNLTIRDITKPIELKVTYTGNIIDPWGNERAGFEIEGRIDRLEYGLKWNMLTDTGGMVAGKDVKLIVNVEMVKQAVMAEQLAWSLLDKSKCKIEFGLVEANKTIEYKLNPLNKGVYVFVMEGSIRREMKVLEKEIRSVLGNSIM